jgi:quinolinate synthase
MNDDKRSAVPKKIEESVRHTQAMTLAHNYLLAEIIGELADAAIDTMISPTCSNASVRMPISSRLKDNPIR